MRVSPLKNGGQSLFRRHDGVSDVRHVGGFYLIGFSSCSCGWGCTKYLQHFNPSQHKSRANSRPPKSVYFLGPAGDQEPIKCIAPEFVPYLGERGMQCVGNG